MKQKTTEKHFIKTVPLSFWQWKLKRDMPVWLCGWSSFYANLNMTLTKNHWKLSDGSKDFQNMCWKAIVTWTMGFEKCHLLKMSFWEVKDLPKNFCSAQTLVSPQPSLFAHVGKPFCGQVMLLGHLVHSFKVSHGLNLLSAACNWSKSMYVWYVSNELKVCSPWEYLWLFFGSVILEHSSSPNVLNFFRVQQKGVWLSDETWKLVAVSFVFFFPKHLLLF